MAQTRFYEDPDFLRSQQLMIALAAIAMLVTRFLPIAYLNSNTQGEITQYIVPQVTVYGSGSYELPANVHSAQFTTIGWVQTVLSVLLIVGCLWAMAQYRKRKLQARSVVSLAFGFLLFPLIAYFNASDIRESLGLGMLGVDSGMTLSIPILGALFLLLAQRSIRKDVALLKRTERFW